MVEKPTTWKQNSIWDNGSEVHISQKNTTRMQEKVHNTEKNKQTYKLKAREKKTDIKIKQIDHIERIYHRIWHFNWFWNTKITPFILIGCQNEIFVLSKIASFLYFSPLWLYVYCTTVFFSCTFSCILVSVQLIAWTLVFFIRHFNSFFSFAIQRHFNFLANYLICCWVVVIHWIWLKCANYHRLFNKLINVYKTNVRRMGPKIKQQPFTMVITGAW